jgi:hypothetical protein
MFLHCQNVSHKSGIVEKAEEYLLSRQEIIITEKGWAAAH